MRVPMPERLERVDTYNRKTGEYCAVGWLAKHLCDIDCAEVENTDDAFQALRELLGKQLLIPIWAPILEAHTNEERLAVFRRVCAEIGVEIEESTDA